MVSISTPVRAIEYLLYYVVTFFAVGVAYKWCGHYFVSGGETKHVPYNLVVVFIVIAGACVCACGLRLLNQEKHRSRFLWPPFAFTACALFVVVVFLISVTVHLIRRV